MAWYMKSVVSPTSELVARMIYDIMSAGSPRSACYSIIPLRRSNPEWAWISSGNLPVRSIRDWTRPHQVLKSSLTSVRKRALSE